MSLTSAPSRSAETYVLDSWPLLEMMLKSAAIAHLDTLIERAAKAEIERAAKAEVVLLLSEVNLGEIFYLIAKRNGDARADAAVLTITRLPIKIAPVSPGDVLKAARLKARSTLSYADCFCACIALASGAPVVAGDPDFLKLGKEGHLLVDWVGV